MSKQLSRRHFLAAMGGAALGLAAPAAAHALQTPGTPQVSDAERAFITGSRPAKPQMYIRTTVTTALRETPGIGQPVADWLYPDSIFPVLETIRHEGANPLNDLWYRLEGGYVYTPTAQPMEAYRMPTIVNEITTQIGTEEEMLPGFWGQLIVPYTLTRLRPSGSAYTLEEGGSVYAYYGSVHRIIAVEQDGAGFTWYRVYNDKPQSPDYYLLARHVRPIPEEDFAPINPGADKEMVVSLAEQRIDCYESGELVFSTLTSSGGEGFGTPKGDHAIVYKQPTRYMYSDPENEAFSDPNFFDLPGVPFTTFFTTLGHAIHGTYWHGDYGRPRSHGCLNVTPADAMWLYRWVEPFAGYEKAAAGSSAEPGTPVIVV